MFSRMISLYLFQNSKIQKSKIQNYNYHMMNKGFFSDYTSPRVQDNHNSRRALMREFLSQDDCDSFSIQEYN